MTNFIHLMSLEYDEVKWVAYVDIYINPVHIVQLYSDGEVTVISFDNRESVHVSETYDEILDKIFRSEH